MTRYFIGQLKSAGRSNDIMKEKRKAVHGGIMSKEMLRERLTEDLLTRLLESKSPEEYLEQGETFDRELSDYLYELLEARGLNRSRLSRISGINSTFLYNIFEGKTKPKRNNALTLAFALECDLRQTQRLLRLADVSELWPKVRRDAIIIWCIENGCTRVECDDELYRLGEATILRATGDLL